MDQTIALLGINMAGHLFRAHHAVGMIIIILEALAFLVLLVFVRDLESGHRTRGHWESVISLFRGSVRHLFKRILHLFWIDTNIFDPSGRPELWTVLAQTFQVIFVAGSA